MVEQMEEIKCGHSATEDLDIHSRPGKKNCGKVLSRINTAVRVTHFSLSIILDPKQRCSYRILIFSHFPCKDLHPLTLAHLVRAQC